MKQFFIERENNGFSLLIFLIIHCIHCNT